MLTISWLDIQCGSVVSSFMMLQNNSTDENWWLMGWPEEKIIGYWPKTLFPDMKESFTSLEWGGYVQVKDPNTKEYPQMGSGVFPEEGYGKAAYFKFIKLMKNSAGEFQDVSPKEVVTFNDRPTCYRVGPRAELLYWPGYHFFYGGPGGNCGHWPFIFFFFFFFVLRKLLNKRMNFGLFFFTLQTNK